MLYHADLFTLDMLPIVFSIAVFWASYALPLASPDTITNLNHRPKRLRLARVSVQANHTAFVAKCVLEAC